MYGMNSVYISTSTLDVHLAETTLHIVLYHSNEGYIETIFEFFGLRRSAKAKVRQRYRNLGHSAKLLPNESSKSFEKVVTEPWVAWVLTTDLRDIHKMCQDIVYHWHDSLSDDDKDSHYTSH